MNPNQNPDQLPGNAIASPVARSGVQGAEETQAIVREEFYLMSYAWLEANDPDASVERREAAYARYGLHIGPAYHMQGRLAVYCSAEYAARVSEEATTAAWDAYTHSHSRSALQVAAASGSGAPSAVTASAHADVANPPRNCRSCGRAFADEIIVPGAGGWAHKAICALCYAEAYPNDYTDEFEPAPDDGSPRDDLRPTRCRSCGWHGLHAPEHGSDCPDCGAIALEDDLAPRTRQNTGVQAPDPYDDAVLGMAPCPQCGGIGQVIWRTPEEAGGVGEEVTCDLCDGSGMVPGREAAAMRDALRKQQANRNAVVDGFQPPYPSEY